MSGQVNIFIMILSVYFYVKMWHNIWIELHVLPFHFGQFLGGL
jgi:hypothetical protein